MATSRVGGRGRRTRRNTSSSSSISSAKSSSSTLGFRKLKKGHVPKTISSTVETSSPFASNKNASIALATGVDVSSNTTTTTTPPSQNINNAKRSTPTSQPAIVNLLNCINVDPPPPPPKQPIVGDGTLTSPMVLEDDLPEKRKSGRGTAASPLRLDSSSDSSPSNTPVKKVKEEEVEIVTFSQRKRRRQNSGTQQQQQQQQQSSIKSFFTSPAKTITTTNTTTPKEKESAPTKPKLTKNTQSTKHKPFSSSSPPTKTPAPQFGLVKIPDSHTSSLSSPPLSPFYPLIAGALLGRTTPTTPITTIENLTLKQTQTSGKPFHLNIGIPPQAECISRTQLSILSINPSSPFSPQPSLTIKVGPSARNPIGIAKFRTKKCGILKRIHAYVKKNEVVTIKEGDVIEFDAYNRGSGSGSSSSSGGGGGPFFVYRLVRIVEEKMEKEKKEEDVTGVKKEEGGVMVPAVSESSNDSFPVGVKNGDDDATTGKVSLNPESSSLSTLTLQSPPQSEKTLPLLLNEDEGGNRDVRDAVNVTQNGNDCATNKAEQTEDKEDTKNKTERKENEPSKERKNVFNANSMVMDAAGKIENEGVGKVDEKMPSSGTEKKEMDKNDKSDKDNKNSQTATKEKAKKEQTKRKNAIAPTQPRSLRTRKTTKESYNKPTAEIGDRFRVIFSTKDMFGIKRSSWFFGTAQSVKKRPRDDTISSSRFDQKEKDSYFIEIEYDDNSRSKRIDYPARDVEKLLPKNHNNKSSDDDSVVYSEGNLMGGGEVGECFAYDENPKSVFVGDLVECRYQNGANCGAWYRGRVLKVNEEKEGGLCCDVVYDDAEYECGIPLGQGHVRLIERVCCNFDWLLGMTIQEDTFDTKDKTKNAKRSKNKRKLEERTGKIIDIRKEENGLDMLERLDSSVAQVVTVTIGLADGSTEDRALDEVVSLLLSSVTGERKVLFWPSVCMATNDKQDQPNSALPSPKNSANIVSPIHEGVDDDDIEFSQDSLFDSPKNSASTKKRGKEMLPSIANTAWRALNTAEPHNGATLLTHLTTVQKVIPNATLAQNLFGMLKFGPKSEGVAFKDPNRMELAHRYISLLSSTSRYQTTSFGPSSWDDVEQCLRQPISETNEVCGNSAKTLSSSATQRLGDSLQAAACAVDSIAMLLRDELGDLVHAHEQSHVDLRSDASKPTVCAFLDDVREALKRSVKWAVRCWIRHGQWMICPKSTPKSKYYSGACAMEAKHCLDSFGRIVCYASWLFCTGEGMSIDNNVCSFLIKDCLLSELGDASNHTENFQKKMKLRFILSLSLDFASPLRTNLARLFEVSSEFSIITNGMG